MCLCRFVTITGLIIAHHSKNSLPHLNWTILETAFSCTLLQSVHTSLWLINRAGRDHAYHSDSHRITCPLLRSESPWHETRELHYCSITMSHSAQHWRHYVFLHNVLCQIIICTRSTPTHARACTQTHTSSAFTMAAIQLLRFLHRGNGLLSLLATKANER